MATYTINNVIPNIASGNKTITIVPNEGHTLPSSVTVTNGTLVSYNSSTGVAVVSGDNAVVNATCASTVIPYLTFSSPDTFTLKVVDNTKHWDGTLQYSTNTTTWNTWAGTSAISSSSSGDTKVLYLRGSNNTIITGSSASNTKAKWVLTGSKIACDGNIENLLDYQTVANGNHPAMASYCFSYLFSGCTSLITAPALPATTLANNCYYAMFRGCTSLITAPALPATTLANNCYYRMFRGCTSLKTAPALPATRLSIGCYQYMFQNCSKIKLSTTQTGEYTQPYRIPTSGTGTTVTSTDLSSMFTNTGGTFTGTPSINTTYYLSNTNTIIP